MIDFQITRLEKGVKDLQQEVSNLERDQRQSTALNADQATELEQLKTELDTSRAQYRNCAQEVRLYNIMTLMI